MTIGMFSFIQNNWQKLFSMDAVKAAQGAINTAPSPENIDAPSKAAGKVIEIYAGTQNLNAQAPNIKLDAVISAVTVAGVAPDQATKKGVAVRKKRSACRCCQRPGDRFNPRNRIAAVHRGWRRQLVENQQTVLRHI